MKTKVPITQSKNQPNTIKVSCIILYIETFGCHAIFHVASECIIYLFHIIINYSLLFCYLFYIALHNCFKIVFLRNCSL